mmetsp:Transcript_10389/g.15659  ORF Transcript_10389/g.15659 Transcript_10389/m.15659 type:complete len:297 (+) Transcript_10389:139-1029(+)
MMRKQNKVVFLHCFLIISNPRSCIFHIELKMRLILPKKKSFPDLYSEKYLSVKGKETTSSPPILGLESIVCVCCEQNAIEPTVDYINRHDEVYAAFGLHPHHSKDYNDALEKKLIDIHQRYPHKVRAWGECGLDFYYNNSSRQQQLDAFERQLNVAVNVVHKPLVIHTRNAEEDTLCLLKKIVPKDWIIHCHCFTSSLQFATDLLEHFENLFIGVTGISTFKNAKDVRDVIEKVPLNRLLLETDAPFLAPDPFRRSKSAHSGHIPWIGLNISKTKKVPFDEVMHQIRLNTKAVYGI